MRWGVVHMFFVFIQKRSLFVIRKSLVFINDREHLLALHCTALHLNTNCLLCLDVWMLIDNVQNCWVFSVWFSSGPCLLSTCIQM